MPGSHRSGLGDLGRHERGYSNLLRSQSDAVFWNTEHVHMLVHLPHVLDWYVCSAERPDTASWESRRSDVGCPHLPTQPECNGIHGLR